MQLDDLIAALYVSASLAVDQRLLSKFIAIFYKLLFVSMCPKVSYMLFNSGLILILFRMNTNST